MRALAVFGGVVALGGWLAANAGVWLERPAPALADPVAEATSEIGSLAASVGRGVQRLRARPPQPPPLVPGRNPFRFTERPQRAQEPVQARPALSTALTPSPVAPDLRLVGVAEDPGPDGPVRTAVLSGLDQLFFVKPGDRFAGHFRVLSVGSDTIQLEDTAEGVVLTLTLR